MLTTAREFDCPKEQQRVKDVWKNRYQHINQIKNTVFDTGGNKEFQSAMAMTAKKSEDITCVWAANPAVLAKQEAYFILMRCHNKYTTMAGWRQLRDVCVYYAGSPETWPECVRNIFPAGIIAAVKMEFDTTEWL